MKLSIVLDLPDLTPENLANEERAIELAEKIFSMVTDQQYTVAHGARAMSFVMAALAKFNMFPESFQHSLMLNGKAIEIGRLKFDITNEEAR